MEEVPGVEDLKKSLNKTDKFEPYITKNEDLLLLNNTSKDNKAIDEFANVGSKTDVKKSNEALYKYEENDKISLTGEDLMLPQEAQEELIDYKKQYKEAEEGLNYLAMNDIHKKSAELRQKYYDYEDDYDYTHGGLMGIYTNYDDSYDEKGYYEHVYKISSDNFGEFHLGAGNNYGKRNDSPFIDVMTSAVAGAAFSALKTINPAVAVAGTAISALSFAIQLSAAGLKESEIKAFEKMQSYCENELTKIKDDDVELYVYLLDGGFSEEIKIRAVKKSTGETLSEGGFDLKQYKPYNAIWNSLEKYGELVSVNRRFWQYSYVDR